MKNENNNELVALKATINRNILLLQQMTISKRFNDDTFTFVKGILLMDVKKYIRLGGNDLSVVSHDFRLFKEISTDNSDSDYDDVEAGLNDNDTSVGKNV